MSNKTQLILAGVIAVVFLLLGGFGMNAIKKCPPPPPPYNMQAADSLTQVLADERAKRKLSEERLLRVQQVRDSLYNNPIVITKFIRDGQKKYAAAGLGVAVDSLNVSPKENRNEY